RRGQRDRPGEIGVDAEVGADPTQDVVDREGTYGGLELRRSPPPVALEWMIPEVDEVTVVTVAVERLLRHPPRQTGDARGDRRLHLGTRDEPGLGALAPTACDQGLDGRQRDHEVAEAERDGSHRDTTHAGRAAGLCGQGRS